MGRALRDRVQAHNDSAHRETYQIPSEVMYGRRLRRGLPLAREAQAPVDTEMMRERDESSKMKKKATEDKRRRARSPDIEQGDKVVLERAAKRKGETPYDPTVLTVKERRRGDLVLVNPSGITIRRDITKVKKLPQVDETATTEQMVANESTPLECETLINDATNDQESAKNLINKPSESVCVRPQRDRKQPTRLVYTIEEEGGQNG